MSEAVITVQEVVTAKPDFVKIKDRSNKTFNCNEQKLLRTASDGNPVFHPGRKLEVSYNEYKPEGQKFASRYINDARPTDKPNTWPDKEPWNPNQPRKSGGNSSGHEKGEFQRSKEQCMRGEAIMAAASVANTPEEALDIAKTFFYPYILGDFETKVADVQEAFDAKPMSDDDADKALFGDDPPF